MQIFWSILLTVLVTAAVFFIISFAEFKKLFGAVKDVEKHHKNFYKSIDEKYVKKIKTQKEKIEKLKYEEIDIIAFDGVMLSGKLYLADKENNKTVILCHGNKSSGELDFSQLFFEYQKQGFNIVMPDQRAHSNSQGGYSSLGVLESFDVISWCNWIELRFGTECPIIIHGVAYVGAFSALAACANSALPKNVTKVIAENAYDSVISVYKSYADKKYDVLNKIIEPLVNMYCRHLAGFDMRHLSLIKLAPKIKIPVMLIVSQQDDLTDANDQKEIAAALKTKTVVECKKSPHAMASVYNENDCVKKIIDFALE